MAASAQGFPTVLVASPAESPTITGAPTIPLLAHVDPVNSTVTLDGVTLAVTAEGDVSVTLSLVEGSNTFVLSAVDWMGEKTRVDLVVILDTVPPVLTLTSPLDESTLTNQAVFAVRGHLEPVDGTVALNGISLPPNVRGDFFYNYTLADGVNVLRFAAHDAAYNQVVVVRTINFDRYSPFLQVDSPANMLRTNKTAIDVLGRSERDAHVTVNGMPAFVNPIDGTFSFLQFELDDFFDATENRLEIKAVDLAGNVRFENRTVVVDTKAPRVVFEMDNDTAQAIAAGVPLRATSLEIRGLTDSQDAVVRVGGELATMTGLTFSWTVDLDEGPNDIFVTAVDSLGNLQEYRLRVIRDLTPPVLTLESPTTASFSTGRSTAEISGWADEPCVVLMTYADADGKPQTQAVSTVEVATPPRFAFAAAIALVPDASLHSVMVRARDLAGNEVFTTFSYRAVAGAPLLEISAFPLIVSEPTVQITGSTLQEIEWVEINGDRFPVVNGAFSVRVHIPNLPGLHAISVRVVNAAGVEAVYSNVTQLVAPTRIVGVAFPGNPSRQLVEGLASSFEVNIEGVLPPDAQVRWYMDGAPLGNGSRIDGVVLPAGEHTLLVEASNATWKVSAEQKITVRVAGAPTLAGRGDDGLLLYCALLASGIAAVGLFTSRTEVGRYYLWWALTAAIVGRNRAPSPLDHFLRGRLYQVISEEPGIHYSELRRRTKASNGAAAHHLHVLEKAGLIRAIADGVKTRFYSTERAIDDQSYGLSDSDRAVLTTVEGKPGITQGELSTSLDRSLSTVNRSVERLAALGYVLTERDGRTVSVFPRPQASAPEGAIRMLPGDD